jgi:hypothetical protein
MPKWKDLSSSEGRKKILESAKDIANKGIKAVDKAVDDVKSFVDCSLNKKDYVELAKFEKGECNSLAVYEYLILKGEETKLSDKEHSMKTTLRDKLTNYEKPSEEDCTYLKEDSHSYLIKLQTECGHTEL